MVSNGPRPHVAGVALSALRDAAHCVLDDESVDDVVVTGITHDSRAVCHGDLYAALPGFNTHGAEFVVAARDAGAVAILTDASGRERAAATGLPILIAADPRAVVGAIAAEIYEHPSRELLVVGITGTNGKTTTSYLLDAAFRAAGFTTGVIGTVGTRIGDEVIPTARTTPEATDVHALLAVMRERGVDVVTMEVSSHALRLGRVDGICFAVSGFTNLTEDHLDFHSDMADYFEAKATLFSSTRTRTAAICVEDSWGELLVRRTGEAELPVTTFALGRPADWSGEVVASLPGGSQIKATSTTGDEVFMTVNLPGAFNATNALGAITMAVLAGVQPDVAARGISSCGGVPGRMERVLDPDVDRGLVVLVDYAHTPDAVERAISAAREGTAGRVIVVLGAGGDRDRSKRPHMGQAAARLADVVIVTDDNPRSEPPAQIRAAVLAGASALGHADVVDIADRREAIGHAVSVAHHGDVVLILGKGHEQGQEVNGVVTPFDDRIVVAAALMTGRTGESSGQGNRS